MFNVSAGGTVTRFEIATYIAQDIYTWQEMVISFLAEVLLTINLFNAGRLIMSFRL